MATADSASAMDTEKGGPGVTTGGHKERRIGKLKRAAFIHRLLVFASCLSAFVVMITDKQHINIPGTNFRIWSKYHYSKAFTWFVVAMGVGFGYALLTMILTLFLRSPKLFRVLLLLDLIVAFILLSACAAATSVAHIGHKGIRQANWAPICNRFGRFCDHVAGALVAGYHGWLFLFITIIFEIHLL